MVSQTTEQIEGLPIPERPNEFSPVHAPPGFEIDYEGYLWYDGGPWWPNRPLIKPKVIIVHTNGASVEANVQSQINHGNRGIQSNTHAHYLLNEPTPKKTVPTNRRGIGNSSTTDWELEHGTVDASFWSLVIETADDGWPVPGHDGGYLRDSIHGQLEAPHIELCARAVAFECIVWDIPPVVPTEYGEPGVVTHTWPWGYPAFTIRPGKVCPGDRKKHEFREFMLARVAELVEAWTADPEPPPPGNGIIKPPPIDPDPDPDPEEDMTKPTHLINYKGIGFFYPDGTVVSGATFAYLTTTLDPPVPIIEDDHDEFFLSVLDQNGSALAAKLGFRAAKRGIDLPGIEDDFDA